MKIQPTRRSRNRQNSALNRRRPQIVELSFSGGYPEGQTEFKAGDKVRLVGRTDKPCNKIKVLDYGACTEKIFKFSYSKEFSILATVANRGTTPQLLSARAQASDTEGEFGKTRDSNLSGSAIDGQNLINCNNARPLVQIGQIKYPQGEGLKNTQAALINIVARDFESIQFESPNNQLEIENPTEFEAKKSATRIAGRYNARDANFKVVATRVANNTRAEATAVVKIAHIPATLSISPGSLAIGDNLITISSNQQLVSIGSLDPGVGEWVDSWSGGPVRFTRTLRIPEGTPTGTYSWENLVAWNLARVQTTEFSNLNTFTV